MINISGKTAHPRHHSPGGSTPIHRRRKSLHTLGDQIIFGLLTIKKVHRLPCKVRSLRADHQDLRPKAGVSCHLQTKLPLTEHFRTAGPKVSCTYPDEIEAVSFLIFGQTTTSLRYDALAARTRALASLLSKQCFIIIIIIIIIIPAASSEIYIGQSPRSFLSYSVLLEIEDSPPKASASSVWPQYDER
jgi:hypothetical protein